MKFTTTEDIEAPIEHVFNSVTDFPTFERSALRRGAEVVRADTHVQPQVGAIWDIAFHYRGKERKLRATLTEFDAPNGFVAEATSKALNGVTQIDLVPLSTGRTRLNFSIELMPKTLPAKLLLRSMALGKGKMNKRFAKKVAYFAEDIEDSFSKPT